MANRTATLIYALLGMILALAVIGILIPELIPVMTWPMGAAAFAQRRLLGAADR
ncbi:hypothetical protein [Arthrobacter zhaoguopingii]|uniref:hypothetical protein n=1 Tax=Arthrobacter zhaoguopingii TaxID=2681491 RepID=UPI00135C7DE9|nr:hypothetical protein [Arthrobacter zhaoguopingii]